MTYFSDEFERLRRQTGPRADVLARILKAKKYIDQHYDAPLCLETISRTANLSRFHFIGQFKRIYGKSPYQYLIEVRNRRAKELLRNGCSVGDACLAVGYSSLPSFSKLLKKMTGCSPSELKKRNFQ